MAVAFVINPADNVATLLDDAETSVDLRGQPGLGALPLPMPVSLGHKVALRFIAKGDPIIKYGVGIGAAGQAIAAGEWVHLHNCVSRFDERSGGFDVVTGAAKDTHYV